MSGAPNFRLHKSPRFSANQLAEYMNTSHAGQRETIIRAAKFPRTTAVVPYTPTRRIVAEFLPKHSDGPGYLDDHLSRLEARHRRESDGWMQDELRRNIEAIQAFKRAFRQRRMARYTFDHGPVDLAMNMEGVRINTRLDARLIEDQEDGTAYGGGLILFLASADGSRKNVDHRSKVVAALIHWSLQEAVGNIEPLERLCLSFDVFGSVLTKAPTSIDRLRSNIRSSCREAARAWPTVPPPPGYDGPDWE